MIPEYIFLVRHGKRDENLKISETRHGLLTSNNEISYKESGAGLTMALAYRLCEELQQLGINEVKIYHSRHLVAQQTAELYKAAFERYEGKALHIGDLVAVDWLTPDSETSNYKDLSNHLDKVPSILISHQPELTQIAKTICGNRLPTGILPLGHSEVALIKDDNGHQLWWMLTEKPQSVAEELKSKIKAKYESAKFLLGAQVIGTGILLDSSTWDTKDTIDFSLVLLGTITLLVAFGLFIYTMLYFDGLTMPGDFWGAEKPQKRPKPWGILRPPSQIQVYLYYEMVHVWDRFFVPALVLMLSSFVFFVSDLFYRHVVYSSDEVKFLPMIVWFIAILIIVFFVTRYAKNQAPNLTVND